MHPLSRRVRPRFQPRRSAHSRRVLRIRLECLEERTLLAVAPIGPIGLLPAHATNAGDGLPADPATILWQGVQRPVVPGRWIVAMDGLQGPAAMQAATEQDLLQLPSHGSGPAVTALRSLGEPGAVLAGDRARGDLRRVESLADKPPRLPVTSNPTSSSA